MSRWLVGIVPPFNDRRWWHPLLHERHKHAFMIRPERAGVWTLVEPWWTRIMIRTVDDRKAIKFLEWAQRGDLFAVLEDNPGTSSQLRGWLTCAALVAHILGRPWQVWTPHGLFERLERDPKARKFDPEFVIRRLRSGDRIEFTWPGRTDEDDNDWPGGPPEQQPVRQSTGSIGVPALGELVGVF